MKTATILLKELILLKEAEHDTERKLLKDHFGRTHESLKLTNIVTSTLESIIAVPGLKGSVINAGIGFAAGFVIKKIFRGNPTRPAVKLLTNII
jgi:hypothetical protein